MRYIVGEAEIDTDTRHLLQNGAETPVERQVFDLIVYLIEHRDRVCTRDELFEEVWGHRFVGDANLTTRIKLAREVLDDDGKAQAQIRTVRGVGYQFVGTVASEAPEASESATQHRVRGDTPLIGRDTLLTELIQALRDSRHVQLVGPGGVGKTRLAAEAVHRSLESSEKRSWTVNLWELQHPSELDNTLISTLGLQHQQDGNQREAITTALSYNPTLLVLDTCEHLLPAVNELVHELLEKCPLLTLVTTSRRLLNVDGAVIEVGTLGDDAVDLFVERAALTRFGFELTEDNEPTVAKLCQRLDGLPLAVELAAARAATLEPSEILDRLDELDAMPTPAASSSTPRHVSAHAAVDWTYHSLPTVEQQIFDRLGLFDGGFTLDAVAAVCSTKSTTALLPYLDDLVDSSLVQVDRTGGARRFTLLDTTRRFSNARRLESGEEDASSELHARYFAEWVTSTADQIWSDDGVSARRKILVELPNLRRAAGWAVATGDAEAASKLALAGTPANAAFRLDCVEWIFPLLEIAGFDDQHQAAAALRSALPLALGIGDVARAISYAQRALAIGNDPYARSLLAALLHAKANRQQPPDPAGIDAAWGHARKAIADAPDDITRLSCYNPLLFFLSQEEDLNEFWKHWDHFEQLLAGTDSDLRWAWSSNAAGALAIASPDRARPIVERGLRLTIELGLPVMTSRLRSHLAAIESRTGSPRRAGEILLEAITDDLQRGARFTAWGWMHRLASILAQKQQLSKAAVLHHTIPPGQSLIWAGDNPQEWLARAQRELGDETYGQLKTQGLSLPASEQLEWLASAVETLPNN